MKWSEVKSLSRVRLFATAWTVAYQAPPSMGFSRQEYWSGLPVPSPENVPSSGIFLTKGSNLGLLHYRQMLYHLSHQGSPLKRAYIYRCSSSVPKASVGWLWVLHKRIQSTSFTNQEQRTNLPQTFGVKWKWSYTLGSWKHIWGPH